MAAIFGQFVARKLDVIHCGKANMIKESRGLLTFEAAELLAVDALAWLAGRPDALGRFLALSGIGPAALRSVASEAGFLAGVLGFLMGDEALLVAYAAHAGRRPGQIAAAHRILNGND